MSHTFATTWLKIAAAITVAVGCMASLASHPAGQYAWLLLFDLLVWPVDGDPAGFDFMGRALNAVLGGVMVGWGAMIYLLASGPIARGQSDIARIVCYGLIAWFVVDSTGSLVAGIPGNVVLNISFLALFLPPLLRLMRDD